MNFRGDLEKKCRELAEEGDAARAEPSILVKRQIDLTLDHINQSRKSNERLLRELHGTEELLGNRILHLAPLKYEPIERKFQRNSLRNHLTRTLVQVQSQRRQLLVHYEKEMQVLHDRLLDWWIKHDQLTDGDWKTTSDT